MKTVLPLGLALVILPLHAQNQPEHNTNPHCQQYKARVNQQSRPETTQPSIPPGSTGVIVITPAQPPGETPAPSAQTAPPYKIVRVMSAREYVSDSATDLLSAAAEARTHLTVGKKQEALVCVNRALHDARQIRTYTRARYVPVYRELSEYTVTGPMYVTPAEPEKGSHESSDRVHQMIASPAVRKLLEPYTGAELDVPMTADHLIAARRAIEADDTGMAQSALSAVQSSMSGVTIASDMPLLRARQNLILARNAVLDHDLNQARVALMATSDALREYSQHKTPYAAKATSLASTIDTCQPDLMKNTADILNGIDQWWNEAAEWTVLPSQIRKPQT
jgi:hypothetical protein